ncbi:MAG: efflux RND transporter periplasmic adaptor subunit, partial [Parasutterella sp.]
MIVFGTPMRRSVRTSAGSVTSPNSSQKKSEVYIENDGQAVPVPLVVGFTDGKMTQVLEGKLSAGDKVIVDQRRGAK